MQVNPELKQHFEDKGFRFVGQDVEGERMEVIELDGTWDICIWKHSLNSRIPNRSAYWSWDHNVSLFCRSSVFCWCTVSPRIHIKTHKTISTVLWSAVSCRRATPKLSSERLSAFTTVWICVTQASQHTLVLTGNFGPILSLNKSSTYTRWKRVFTELWSVITLKLWNHQQKYLD